MRVLILGGTTEASELARLIAADQRFAPVLSLAGRTARPAPQPIPARVGGFGGAAGLAAWMTENRTDALVDATHPYAVRISANAVTASIVCRVPLISIVRPPWEPAPGDHWRQVADMARAAAFLPAEPRNIWLTIGGNELAAFQASPQHHYLVRAVDAPPDAVLPPDARVILARGPFDVEAERQLIREHRIDILVTKNSGGVATEAKLIAARIEGVPIIMVRRPPKPIGEPMGDATEAMRWLEARHATTHEPGGFSDRGV